MSHRSKPLISEPLTPLNEMTVDELSAEMDDLRNKKKSLLQQIDDIESLFIGYREELRKRVEIRKRKDLER